jgi:hypothetical protein
MDSKTKPHTKKILNFTVHPQGATLVKAFGKILASYGVGYADTFRTLQPQIGSRKEAELAGLRLRSQLYSRQKTLT